MVAVEVAAAVVVVVDDESETRYLRAVVGTETVAAVAGMFAAGIGRIALLVVIVLEVAGRSVVVAAMMQIVGMGCSLIVAIV